MKAFYSPSKLGWWFVWALIAVASGASSFAQTAVTIPIVTVQATQPFATTTSPGVFTVFRAGDTNATLNVWYDLDGTASNGVDYAPIPPHLVTINAGATSNTIVITTLNNPSSSIVAKTVVLTLTNSPLLTPVNYEIGSPNRAVVYVETSGTTNLPPAVSIIEPADGAVFYTPTNIQMLAQAGDPDGSTVSVEFFAGTNDLGPGTPVVLDPPGVNGVTGLVYLFNWLNPPPGNYPLTAVATDNGGASTTSAAVNIAVLQGPPTNLPPVVTIVATDPVAIEGTNCWVWPGETNSTPTWAAWPTAVCRFFTNCGPTTATFTVRSFGETNDDVTVAYDIGGTASNGVDYVALPGSVTVPAGEDRALITIVPIDDGPPDVNKTVILTLAPSTNLPPDYVVGIPHRAAGIIIDSDGPRPVTARLPDNCFHVATSAPNAAWFSIEWSADLINWQPVCTNQVINGSVDFVDPDAPGSPSRFYRIVPLAGPPN